MKYLSIANALQSTKISNIYENSENKFGIDSGLFMEKFDSVGLRDDVDFFDWYAAKTALNILSKN